jgi:1-pyrroline-5-carboxylate dehydrogenase
LVKKPQGDSPTGNDISVIQPPTKPAGTTMETAGRYLSLIRWASARTIKETFVAATEHHSPFMDEA